MTLVFIMVASVLVVGIHAGVYSYIEKVAESYDEKQAYLTARSAATAVAEEIVVIYNGQSQGMTATEIETSAHMRMVLDTLAIGSTIEMEDMEFTGITSLEGVVTGYILRTASGYEVIVQADVDGMIEVVTLRVGETEGTYSVELYIEEA